MGGDKGRAKLPIEVLTNRPRVDGFRRAVGLCRLLTPMAWVGFLADSLPGHCGERRPLRARAPTRSRLEFNPVVKTALE